MILVSRLDGASAAGQVPIRVRFVSREAEPRRIRAKYLNQSTPLASTLVEAGLLGNGLLLEVEAVAIVLEEQFAYETEHIDVSHYVE